MSFFVLPLYFSDLQPGPESGKNDGLFTSCQVFPFEKGLRKISDVPVALDKEHRGWRRVRSLELANQEPRQVMRQAKEGLTVTNCGWRPVGDILLNTTPRKSHTTYQETSNYQNKVETRNITVACNQLRKKISVSFFPFHTSLNKESMS